MIKNVTTEAEFDAAIAGGTKLVDFWATWCGPCKMMGAILEAKVAPVKPEVDIIKVDVDQCPQLAVRYGVQSIPMLLVFKDGRQSAGFVGVTKPDELLAAL